MLLTVSSASPVTFHVFQKELNYAATYQERKIPAEEHWFNGRTLDLHCRPEARIVPCGCGSVTVPLPR